MKTLVSQVSISRARIGFSTNKRSWISKIIRWFTSSPVSHVFLVYYDPEWSMDMVMESEGGLGGSVRIVRFNPDNQDIVAVARPAYSVEAGMTRMVYQLGELYDYRGLFGMAWVLIGRWLIRRWNNPWHRSKALFCSELVSQVLLDSKYPGWSCAPSMTSPDDLYDFFMAEKQVAQTAITARSS